MKFRSLDSNWDWSFGRGTASYSEGALAIAYDIKSKILSWYRDCFFSLESGIDWKNILGSKDQKNKLDMSIKLIIFEQEDVTEITYFDSEIIGREYSCTIRLKTIYNETIEVKI